MPIFQRKRRSTSDAASKRPSKNSNTPADTLPAADIVNGSTSVPPHSERHTTLSQEAETAKEGCKRSTCTRRQTTESHSRIALKGGLKDDGQPCHGGKACVQQETECGKLHCTLPPPRTSKTGGKKEKDPTPNEEGAIQKECSGKRLKDVPTSKAQKKRLSKGAQQAILEGASADQAAVQSSRHSSGAVTAKTSKLRSKDDRISSGGGSKLESLTDNERRFSPDSLPQFASKSALTSTQRRRSRVPERLDVQPNLWSLLKGGKGAGRSMPIEFFEPLSTLQRLAEEFECSYILDKATQKSNISEQLAYVGVFSVASYATTADRFSKPFTPLLGETFEFDRIADLGWRLISEEVEHHPSTVAQHCQGHGWVCWQELTTASKFRGNDLHIIPHGSVHVMFSKTGNHYSWRKVLTILHNMVMGTAWVEQSGEAQIICHNNNVKCYIQYVPSGWFKAYANEVKGFVMGEKQDVSWIISGSWNSHMDIAPVLSNDGTASNPSFKTGPSTRVWTKKPAKVDSKKFYNFRQLTCELNEPEDGVAPTDSRLRPDQRLMENRQWEEATLEKNRLEQKQREAAAAREANKVKYQPLWFKLTADSTSINKQYAYSGRYWKCKAKQDWSLCPDIF